MERIDRRKALAEAALSVEKEIFSGQCRKLEQEYQKKARRTQVVEVFAQIFQQAEEKQKEVSWLGICYLHTGRRQRSYEFLLSLYDKNFYFDADPVEGYWYPSCFFEFFEEDMKSVIKELKKHFFRIWDYEEEYVRSVCVEYYYAAVCQLCADLAGEIMAAAGFQKLKKAESFAMFFGRYQGEGEILWLMKEE